MTVRQFHQCNFITLQRRSMLWTLCSFQSSGLIGGGSAVLTKPDGLMMAETT